MKLIPLSLIAAVLVFGQEGAFNTPYNTRVIPGRVAAQPTVFDCAASGSVVNSITGEPILRAHVNISVAGTTWSAATDSSGSWTLTNIGCAPGQLIVTRPGFLQTTGNGKGTAANAIRSLNLVSGSPVSGIGTELVPQSVAAGKVVDDQGDPVVNAQVTVFALRVTNGKNRFQQAGTTSTNDLGEYRLASLARGKYVFCATQREPLESASKTVTGDACYPGPLDGGAASALDMPAGRETKVDFALNQVPEVHVRGTISGMPEGRGSGVTIRKQSANATFSGFMPGIVRDNKFDFRVTPGSYMLTADYFESGKRLSARLPIEAGNSDIEGIDLHLDSGFTVTGTVRVESQSAQTAAPAQIPVNLLPSEEVIGNGRLKWGEDHTSFTFSELMPASYRLVAGSRPPYYVKSATLAGQDILNTDLPISQAAGPIEIVLRDDGGSIDGDVVDAAGQPVAAGIMLLRDTARVATSMSQPNGHFKLSNVPPGDYTIYAWDDSSQVAYAEPDWMHRYGTGGAAVTVTANQNTQVKLTEQLVPPQ